MASAAYSSYMFCADIGLFPYTADYSWGGKLLLPVIVYYSIPGIILRFFGETDYIGGGQQVFLFLSKSPYWFIKAYFCLFLIAPVLNKYLDDASLKRKMYLLLSMLFVSVYGAMMGDAAYEDGKNIALFMTLYILGDILKEQQPQIDMIRLWAFGATWLLLNALIVFLFCHFESSTIGTTIWNLAFLTAVRSLSSMQHCFL